MSKGKKLFQIKGETQKETIENFSFLMILISAILISIGLGIASFVKYTIVLSIIGAFFLLVGLIIFIVNEFIHS